MNEYTHMDVRGCREHAKERRKTKYPPVHESVLWHALVKGAFSLRNNESKTTLVCEFNQYHVLIYLEIYQLAPRVPYPLYSCVICSCENK